MASVASRNKQRLAARPIPASSKPDAAQGGSILLERALNEERANSNRQAKYIVKAEQRLDEEVRKNIALQQLVGELRGRLPYKAVVVLVAVLSLIAFTIGATL